MFHFSFSKYKTSMSKSITTKMREAYFQEDHTIKHMGPVEIANKGSIDNLLRVNELEVEIDILEKLRTGKIDQSKMLDRIASLKRSLLTYKKMVLMIFFLCFLFSCSFPVKEYKFAIEYFNGQKDTITWTGTGENSFFLRSGDFVVYKGDNSPAIISGVRSFRTLSIIQKAVNVPIHNN